MKIDCQLDYRTILSNSAQPVHLVLKLTAHPLTHQRAIPLAFCVVLDRSGSMQGNALEYAKKACEIVVKNLRADDLFALTVFDDVAQVVIPLQKIASKSKAVETIREIQSGASTNLTGGWTLGRDELKKAPKGVSRRLLLLTDGHLNHGITDHSQVERIVASGLEMDQVRTACLGFGDSYEETLLRQLSKVSGGEFYDADSPEKLSVIFKSELEGLQKITAQNVRIRLKKLDFCERWVLFSDYPGIQLPDGRVETTIGDLVSEEDRVLVMLIEVLPLPLFNGQPVTTLEGEQLVQVELLWDEIGEKEIKSCQHEQTIRVLGTQDAKDVKLNEEVVAWIAVQRAGKVVDDASKDVRANKLEDAKSKVKEAISALKRYGMDEKVGDGLKLMETFLDQLEQGPMTPRAMKAASYSSEYYRHSKPSSVWTGPAAATPKFSKAPSAEDQIKGGGSKPSGKKQTRTKPESTGKP
jgi:Ca-activated chloride channel family protein